MLPSTHCSCHWDHSDTTDSHSVYPSPCTKWIHQMVANLQAWTKLITWQGPQVGMPGVLVNTIFWLAPQACMMHSISFEGNFSFFLMSFRAVFPTRVANKFLKQQKLRNLTQFCEKRNSFINTTWGLQFMEVCKGAAIDWFPKFAWILCWLYFLPSPAP